MSQKYIERLETSLVKVVETPESAKEPEIVDTYAEAKGNIKERKRAMREQIEMTPVKSTNIRFVGYDKETFQLRVQFTNGGLFQYSGVPEEVYDEMMNSESVGAYFSRNIRNAYPTINLTNLKPKE